MWKFPWKYKEAIVISLILLIMGTLLQFSLHSFPLDRLKYPTNIIIGGNFLLFIILLAVWGKRNKYIRWFSQTEVAITSLCTMLILVIVMGLTKQEAPHQHLTYIPRWSLGFSTMTRSWIFVVHFFYFLTILGLVTLRRLLTFKKKDIIFTLNHLGLFIALFSGIFGNGDIQRLRMQTNLNKPEWRAFDKYGKVHKLPFSIKLTSFEVVEYSPKLLIIDNITKKSLPIKLPENIVISDSITKGKLLDWDITANNFLPFAVPLLGTDTENYISTQRKGATSAVYIKATHKDMKKEGWVSCGNAWFPYKLLKLNEQYSIAMPPLAPKQFISQIEAEIGNNRKITKTIKVNNTINIKGWKIYQVSYNEQMGRWSTSSILEFVKDPWLPFVYVGIGLMLAGALSLFLFAKRPSTKTID